MNGWRYKNFQSINAFDNFSKDRLMSKVKYNIMFKSQLSFKIRTREKDPKCEFFSFNGRYLDNGLKFLVRILNGSNGEK